VSEKEEPRADDKGRGIRDLTIKHILQATEGTKRKALPGRKSVKKISTGNGIRTRRRFISEAVGGKFRQDSENTRGF